MFVPPVALCAHFTELQRKGFFDVIAFDHHEREKSSIANGFINPQAFSTTELLYNLLKKSFNKKMSLFASVGMIEDTGRFLVGSSNFFRAFYECLKKSKVSYAKVFEYSKHIIPQGEKIAFLKAVQRARINKINGFIVMTSRLAFYQSAAATKLLEFGAHISIVVGREKDGATHLSARAETVFKEEKNFNLVRDLLIPLQQELGGEMGGHSGAAQWKGSASGGEVLSFAIKILVKKLND